MPTRRRSETGEKPLNGVIRGGIVETPNVMAFPAGTPRGGEVPEETERVHVFLPSCRRIRISDGMSGKRAACGPWVRERRAA